MKKHVRLAALAAGAFLCCAALPATAAPSGRAASADAYGLLVDLVLQPTQTLLRHGPVSRASQDTPPGAAQPNEAQVTEYGPLPGDGSLVNHVGVLTSIAGATATPQAVASAEVADVSLLRTNGSDSSVITADLVRAQANTDCANLPNATGTTFVNLKINGTPIESTPAPNTVIDLSYAKVILNEQRPAYDGRGIVVNAIHVVSTTTGDALFRGDIVVAHAMSTVSCTNGAGSTGESNVVRMVKTVDDSTAEPGDELTYTATVTNSSSSACLVTALIDHLPQGFELVSTAGDLGFAPDRMPPTARPGGGLDVYVGNGRTIYPGATATQRFVVRVGSVPPGVYYNNLEIYCANLGQFVKGLDAPVQVVEESAPQASPTPSSGPVKAPVRQPTPAGNDRPLAHTGGPAPLWPMVAIALAGGAFLTRRLRGTG